MKNTKVKELQEDEQQVKRDIVMKEGKIYISRDIELRAEIIQLHHNVLVVRHRERQKMMELITRNYWWPEITKDIGRYVEGCNIC